MLWALIRSLCFHGAIRDIGSCWLKKAPYLELYVFQLSIFLYEITKMLQNIISKRYLVYLLNILWDVRHKCVAVYKCYMQTPFIVDIFVKMVCLGGWWGRATRTLQCQQID